MKVIAKVIQEVGLPIEIDDNIVIDRDCVDALEITNAKENYFAWIGKQRILAIGDYDTWRRDAGVLYKNDFDKDVSKWSKADMLSIIDQLELYFDTEVYEETGKLKVVGTGLQFKE